MDYRYRKRPVVIEAFQMTKERRRDNSEWPNWLHQAWNLDPGEAGALYPTKQASGDTTLLSIMTLEGEHSVTWDDWIIQGVKGELYPVKDEIFRLTYEPVDAPGI